VLQNRIIYSPRNRGKPLCFFMGLYERRKEQK